MARRNPNIMAKRFIVKVEWLEDGEEGRMEIDLEADTESAREIIAHFVDDLSTMLGSEKIGLKA